MTLNEFYAKWQLDHDTKIKGLLSAFFERDERTIRRWRNKTPYYVQWCLKEISKKWEESGKSYRIFFD